MKKNSDPRVAQSVQLNNIKIRDGVARFISTRPDGQIARLAQFVFNNPDRFTHEIERECAIGYAPARAIELNRELARYGVQLRSFLPDPKDRLVNRFGQITLSHRWRLELLPVSGGGNES